MNQPIAMRKNRPIAMRRYELGSRGHSKTLQAMYEYHEAKRKGKSCLIVAKSEEEKLRLCVNHNVDPADVVLASDIVKN